MTKQTVSPGKSGEATRRRLKVGRRIEQRNSWIWCQDSNYCRNRLKLSGWWSLVSRKGCRIMDGYMGAPTGKNEVRRSRLLERRRLDLLPRE